MSRNLKIKSILREVINEQKVNDFFIDCNHFLDNNKSMLLDGFYLNRATKKHGDIKKRPARKRRSIKGSKSLFYYYEKYLPDSIPSRIDQVPCSGGSLSSVFESRLSKTYAVFPVGSSYEMVYIRDAADFNVNHIVRSFNDEPLNLLRQMKKELKNNDGVDEPIRKYLMGLYGDIHRKEISPQDIKKHFGKLEDILQRNQYKLEDKLPTTYKTRENLIETTQYMVKHTQSTTKLSDKLDNVEVGLYAPNGFYYISMGEVKNILEKYYETH